MKLQATKKIRVFIDKGTYNLSDEHTPIKYIPENKRESISWKGCYYTIEENEIFYFDNSNGWDKSYFKLECGVRFCIECGDYIAWINRNNIIKI
jgi:hypothetical protein